MQDYFNRRKAELQQEYNNLTLQKSNLSRQLKACRERMAAMARALGKSDAQRPEDFLTALDALQKECSVDGLALSSFGMSPEEFPALTCNARETMGGLFEVDPVVVSDGDVLEILSDAFC